MQPQYQAFGNRPTLWTVCFLWMQILGDKRNVILMPELSHHDDIEQHTESREKWHASF